MTPERRDRILYWPTALAIAWLVLFSVPDSLNLAAVYLDRPFVLFYWLISAGAGVIACIAWMCERQWRRLLSTIVLPLSVLVAGFNLQSIWQLERYIELHLMHPTYHGDTSSTRAAD